MKKTALLLALSAAWALVNQAAPAHAVDPAMHSSASVGSSKYNTWGETFTCGTCHKSSLSGGNAKAVSDSVANKPVSFTTYQSYGTDSAHSTSNQICEVCHTKTTHHRYDNSVNGANHNGTVNCTTCHLHNNGFGSESQGGLSCDGCHADLYLNSSGYGMHSQTPGVSYKHFMNNASTTSDPLLTGGKVGASWYATNIPDGAGTDGVTGSPNARRCLMCHVDHDQFKNNKRAFNLRPNVTQIPTGGGMNRDDNLCLSCHNAEKTKAVIGPNGETKVMPIPYPTIAFNNATTVLNNSTHGYPISTTYSDGTIFNAICAKCHNDSIGRNGESPKSAVKGQKGTSKFGEHNSTVPGRFAILGNDFYQRQASGTTLTLNAAGKTVQVGPTSPGWPTDEFQGHYFVITSGGGTNQRSLITTNSADTLTLQTWPAGIDTTSSFDVVDDNLPVDNICFSCHSKNGEEKSSGANLDWYGQKSMSDTLEGIFDIFVGDEGRLPASLRRGTSVSVTLSKNSWTTANIKGFILKTPGGKRVVNAASAPTGTGPYSYTLTIATSLNSAAGPVELIKPASHPLDMNARHESDERVAAGAGWNLGDQGNTTGTNSATAATQITDGSKAWSGSEFTGQKITFPNLFDSAGNPVRSTVTGGGVGIINFSPAVSGLDATNFGDNYYLGTRHVSCADCHNPHASFRNPEGKPSSAATANTLTDTTHANIPGWYDNIWTGFLLRVRSTAGVEQVRFITGFSNASGQYTVSLPWSTNPDTTYTYEVLMGDKWSLAGQIGGRAGSGSSGIWGIIPTGWRAAAPKAGFNNMTTPSGYRKIENVFDNLSSTGLRGSTIAGQRDLCVKCHSSYAYGTVTPATPSGNAIGGNARGTDVSKEFNPNNLSHHAVYARGKNQPITVGNPAKKTGTVSSATTTVITVTAGGFDATYVGKTFVVVTGTGQGQARLISAQTATTLTLATALTTAPGSTSQFVVLDSFNPNWPIYNGVGTGTVTVAGGTASFTGATLPRTTLPGWFLYTFNDNTWREVRTVDTATSFKVTGADVATTPFILTAGLGNTFVPPFGPWSILRCTDCHGSTKTDPVGPHASVNNWLIKDADTMQYYWFAGGADTNVSLINQGLPTTVASPKKYFCYNCHRRDVYGDKDMRSPANYQQSRQPHANYLDTNTNTTNDTRTKWGVHCRLCHAGDRVGGIHGTNLQSTATPNGAYTNNQGQRFLNGSAWGTHNLGVKRSTTQATGACYTSGTITDASVDACGYSHNGTNYQSKANYDY